METLVDRLVRQGDIPEEAREALPQKIAEYRENGSEANAKSLVDQMLAVLNTDAGTRLLGDMILFRDAYMNGDVLAVPLTASGVRITLAMENEEDA